MQYNEDAEGPGQADTRLDDFHWRDRVGDDAERVFREALRRAVALRDGGSVSRAVVLVDVLNRLGELSGFDTSDIWSSD